MFEGDILAGGTRLAGTLGSMPLPGWLARLNRRLTNPALRPVAERLPRFGVVLHVGRGTGRVYRTPVNVFRHRNRFVIALTYGREVDWVRNVIAAGRCRLVHRGRTVDLVGPKILPLRDEAMAIPLWVRGILRALGVDQVLRLEQAPLPDRDGGDHPPEAADR